MPRGVPGSGDDDDRAIAENIMIPIEFFDGVALESGVQRWRKAEFGGIRSECGVVLGTLHVERGVDEEFGVTGWFP